MKQTKNQWDQIERNSPHWHNQFKSGHIGTNSYQVCHWIRILKEKMNAIILNKWNNLVNIESISKLKSKNFHLNTILVLILLNPQKELIEDTIETDHFVNLFTY